MISKGFFYRFPVREYYEKNLIILFFSILYCIFFLLTYRIGKQLSKLNNCELLYALGHQWLLCKVSVLPVINVSSVTVSCPFYLWLTWDLVILHQLQNESKGRPSLRNGQALKRLLICNLPVQPQTCVVRLSTSLYICQRPSLWWQGHL